MDHVSAGSPLSRSSYRHLAYHLSPTSFPNRDVANQAFSHIDIAMAGVIQEHGDCCVTLHVELLVLVRKDDI